MASQEPQPQPHNAAIPVSPMWAEYGLNTAPEVVVENAPEAVIVDLENGNDGAGDVNDGPNKEEPAAPKSHSRKRLWTGLIFIGIAILIATVIALPIYFAKNNDTDTPKITAGGSSSANPSTTSTSTESAPSTAPPSSTSSPDPLSECETSKFRLGVNWLGVYQGQDWKFTFSPAKGPQECCTACYKSTPEGCNSWMYVQREGPAPACNLVVGYTGPNKTDSCPNGQPDVVFSKDASLPGGEGAGPGPCSGSVR